MKIEFDLYIPPFSINNQHAIGRRVKFYTKKYLDWRRQALIELMKEDVQEKMFNLRQVFKEDEHALHIGLTFCQPEKTIFTKKNTISIRSMDLSNVEKVIIDLVFDKRFDMREVSHSSELYKNLAIDDKYIVRMESEKKVDPNDMFIISVVLKLVETKDMRRNK